MAILSALLDEIFKKVVTAERELEAADAAMKQVTMDMWSKDSPPVTMTPKANQILTFTIRSA
jgi:hypothetical protein